jgi:hypothetical protein
MAAKQGHAVGPAPSRPAPGSAADRIVDCGWRRFWSSPRYLTFCLFSLQVDPIEGPHLAVVEGYGVTWKGANDGQADRASSDMKQVANSFGFAESLWVPPVDGCVEGFPLEQITDLDTPAISS